MNTIYTIKCLCIPNVNTKIAGQNTRPQKKTKKKKIDITKIEGHRKTNPEK